jgi:hypothetical protein
MKKIFEILQMWQCPVILGIIFFGVPKWTVDFGLTAMWVILGASTIVLLLVLWYLLAKWQVTSRGYLTANGGAAFTGVVSSLMIFAYAHGDMNNQELNLGLLLSFCFGIVIFGWGIICQCVVKPWKDDEGYPPSTAKITPTAISRKKVLQIGRDSQ